MFQRFIPYTFKANMFITFLMALIFAVGCRDSVQQKSASESTDSASSTGSTLEQGGGEFEGIITMMMNTEDQKGMEMVYSLKGTRTRIETKLPGMPEGQGVMLWDLEGGKMITLIPARKMFMTMDLKGAAENMKDADRGQDDAMFPKLTPTGKQETIAGYTCEHWLMGDKQDIDMCVAKGLGYFGMGDQIGGDGSSFKSLIFNPKLLAQAAAHPEWVRFLKGGAFPLKITMTEEGKVNMTMEVTKVERKSLDDSLFNIPQGYKEFNMQDMMRGKR